ncbi:hypothetical protein ACFPM0_23390 [Pseudonocardia sulfidoxydans]|uniref:hypothetical protein n=1 Tax=Pseudonocardia sulfidoxydans TaxID=54011 RepID=UPI00361510DA
MRSRRRGPIDNGRLRFVDTASRSWSPRCRAQPRYAVRHEPKRRASRESRLTPSHVNHFTTAVEVVPPGGRGATAGTVRGRPGTLPAPTFTPPALRGGDS